MVVTKKKLLAQSAIRLNRFGIPDEYGFTLIELMIVIAIIGILSVVVFPKFTNLVDKARESATKGNLGALRSAITVYYGDNEGHFPYELDSNWYHPADYKYQPFVPKYIESVPRCYLRKGVENDPCIISYEFTNEGGWWYNRETGKITVNKSALDSWGENYLTW